MSQIYFVRYEPMSPIASYSLSRDSWLAAIFGQPVWRVESRGGDVAFSALVSDGPAFAYAKCQVSRVDEVSALCDFGFRVIDTALTLEGVVDFESGYNDEAVRFANADDRDAVRAIAGQAFRFSRFHLDPLISVRIADEIKASWAGNYFAGRRGDSMVVAESNGEVVGFLQLLWGQEGILIIDLIGVVPKCQGQGFGIAMIRHAAMNGTGDDRKPTRMLVGTQAANITSVRFYESLGLRLRSAQYVLHFHGKAQRTVA
jgi:ribosomal protein S18 acetylase RimI-like enzyme